MHRLASQQKRKKALLSPFRYPGGKTWLRPIIRQWLHRKVDELGEPFAGSGVVSITALNEDLAKKVIIIELDPSVASVWEAMLNGEAGWLRRRIKTFKATRRNVCKALEKKVMSTRDAIWTTLLRNRVSQEGRFKCATAC